MLPFAGWLYGKIAELRNSMYDRGVFRTYPLGARTISIGNITTGGTGKTPLVVHVAELLADAGEKVCILTRGYGRENARLRVLVSDGDKVLVDAHKGGDEPVEMGQRLLGKVAVVADANRVSAAAWAKDKLRITAFVLDDGFQHRRAKRDLDIVCIDAMNPFGGGRVLPAGDLREPLRNLARADAIVITRSDVLNIQINRFVDAFTRLVKFVPRSKADLDEWYREAQRLKTDHLLMRGVSRYLPHFVWHYLSDADIRMKDETYAAMQNQRISLELEDLKESVDEVTKEIQANSPNARVFIARTQISGFRSLREFEVNEEEQSWRELTPRGGDRLRALAFCALGNPEAFFGQLSIASPDKLDVSVTHVFPDHHYYTRSDISMLETKARAAQADVFLTTAKDAVKLFELAFELPCYVVDIEVGLDDPAGFRKLVTSS
ncbi:MAG TPA: tetraacyldisaccharide 4'-kinase [Pyrinomonadaceae bacterium]